MESKSKSLFNNGHASSTCSFLLLCTLIYPLFYLSLISFFLFPLLYNVYKKKYLLDLFFKLTHCDKQTDT